MPTPPHLRQESPTCIAEDVPGVPCGKPSKAHSLCATHAKRLERNGTIELRRAPNGSQTPCKHPDGCTRPRRSRDGWCHMHVSRVRKSPTGDPGPAHPIPPGPKGRRDTKPPVAAS